MEIICKHLVGRRMLKQFSICQMPEIETDELFLWTSTTAPAEKADPFCQGSLVETVDCKSEFSFWTSGTQKIPSKCSYVIRKKKNVPMCTLPWAQWLSSLVATGLWGWRQLVYMFWTKVHFMKPTCCTCFFLPFLDE